MRETLRSDTTAEPLPVRTPVPGGENAETLAGDELDRAVQMLREMALVLAAGQAELAGLQQRVETALAAASDLVTRYAELAAERLWSVEATVDPLSDRESVVLRLLAEGHTDDVVARRLGMSARTVRRIVTVVMSRLDARSRFEAGVHAVQRGWLSGRS